MGTRGRQAVAVIGALAAFVLGGVRAPAAQAYTFRMSVTTSPATRPLADNFLGLALEYSTVPTWVGTGSQPGNPVLVQLIRDLDPVGRPVIRIGGQSTDRTWWPVPGMRQPLGVTYTLTPAWIAAARTLAQASNAKLLLGLNLEADRPKIDQVEAAQLLSGIGSSDIEALELGNEPDLYTVTPWYHLWRGTPLPWYSHQGKPVYARRPQYGTRQFVAEFSRASKLLPPLPLAGPEAGSTPWLAAFSPMLSSGSRVRMLTSHAYGSSQCVTDPSSPFFPSVPNLLSLSESRGLLGGVAQYVRLAHSYGATYRIDEMGSISCNGRAGISNTMASALWVMDALFSIADDDIDGVNLHTYPNSVNGLFDFTRSNGQWMGTVHPLYYGALMFALAAPAGSRVLQIATTSQDQLRAWATIGRDHWVRVLLINDSLHRSALALVRAPRGFRRGAASIERLLAPSAYATTGVTLGGWSFGAATPTGMLPALALPTIAPRAGTYTVTLPPSSAVLLTLAPG